MRAPIATSYEASIAIIILIIIGVPLQLMGSTPSQSMPMAVSRTRKIVTGSTITVTTLTMRALRLSTDSMMRKWRRSRYAASLKLVTSFRGDTDLKPNIEHGGI